MLITRCHSLPCIILESGAPQREQIFVYGSRIGNTFQDTGKRVGEKDGKDEFHWSDKQVNVGRKCFMAL